MRRVIILVLVTIACSGCGAFRKVFKLKESHTVEVVHERRTDSVGVRVDKSTITTVERIDTVVTTPEHTTSQETPLNMDSLVNGMTAIKNDLIDVRLHLNPVTGILSAVATIKTQPVSVRLDRVTTKKNDITEQTRKQEAVLSQTKTEDKRSEVDKEPIKVPNWLIIIAILLVAGASYLFWWRRR